MNLHIADMHCGGCVRSVTKTIQKLDPDARVEADIDTRRVTVTTRAPQDALLAALADTGYPATAV